MRFLTMLLAWIKTLPFLVDGKGRPILIEHGDFANWAPFYTTKATLWKANRHQGEGSYVWRQVQDRLNLILGNGVVRGEDRPKSQPATSQNDVLHGRIDARPSCPRGCCFHRLLDINRNLIWKLNRVEPEARDKQHRCLSHMFIEVEAARHHTFVLAF